VATSRSTTRSNGSTPALLGDRGAQVRTPAVALATTDRRPLRPVAMRRLRD
jgi:hypothetical protein